MGENYSYKKLQKASFQNRDLTNANFNGSDLRGSDFTGSDLSGADFSQSRTGITTGNTVLIFIAALIVSLFSGYLAMLTGHTIQMMLRNPDDKIRWSGIISLVVLFIFILFSYWKGIGNSILHLVFPTAIISILIGVIAYTSGMGTGRGMLLLFISCFLFSIMFIVGTISRAAAGALSSTVLFVIVALGGGIFGKSLGGGIGTVVMAISCALISKRALSGAKGFATVQKITGLITSKLGTSFRNTKLVNANFSQSKIQNTDFTNADFSQVNWGDSKKKNCIINLPATDTVA